MSGVVGRVILYTLAGFAAGLLTWVVSDVFGPLVGLRILERNELADPNILPPQQIRAYYLTFCAWGGFIGMLLSAADTYLSGGRQDWGKSLAVGAAVGVVSGVVGGSLGMAVYGALDVARVTNPLQFIQSVLARAMGYALIGAFAGTADGWRKLSLPIGRNGFIGGLIGGVLGGVVFEIIPYLVPGLKAGPASRLFAFTITGAMIGLFVSLVSEFLKEAWLKVLVGRNEGKEYLIYQTETRVGRSELSDIPLYGDTNIAKDHAVVRTAPGGGFVVADVSGSPSGVYVNGQRVQGEYPLRSGDQIQIGQRAIMFYERATRAPSERPTRDAARPAPVGNGLPSLADLPTVPVGPRPGVGANGGGDTIPSIMPAGFGTADKAPASGADGPAPQIPAARRSAQGNTIAGQLIMKGTRLVVTGGPYTGSTFPVRAGAAIGRNPEGDIALPADGKASRLHARLVADGNAIAIEDAGSTNGTFVNGQRVTRQTLTSGDTIVIGTTTLRYE
jgi:pSer/pThr/pTyr-binding forkhead associated (FHA) protein